MRAWHHTLLNCGLVGGECWAKRNDRFTPGKGSICPLARIFSGSQDRSGCSKNMTNFFDVLLTVHLSIFISVINQLDAKKFCFTISLFHASTCFEHMCSSSGGQKSITQPLVSSHLWVAVSCTCARDCNSPKPQAGGQPLVGCPRLLIQYIRSYPPYRWPFLYPQPEVAPCRGDRDPLITGVQLLSILRSYTKLWVAPNLSHSNSWCSHLNFPSCHLLSVALTSNRDYNEDKLQPVASLNTLLSN